VFVFGGTSVGEICVGIGVTVGGKAVGGALVGGSGTEVGVEGGGVFDPPQATIGSRNKTTSRFIIYR
jgi:hypothetical protein